MEDDVRINWKSLYVPEAVMKAIIKEQYIFPTEIQKMTLPSAIRNRCDVLGASATGTGKTLAFGIPMVARILADREKEMLIYEAHTKVDNKNDNMDSEINESTDDNSSDVDSQNEDADLSPNESELEMMWKDGDVTPAIEIATNYSHIKSVNVKPYQHVYGVVFTPTHELANQVATHLRKICQFTDLKIAAIFGGMSIDKQERLLSKRPEILVVTPGRFWSFIMQKDDHAVTTSKLSVLVIDEADRLLEKNHFSELRNFIDWLKENKTDRKVYGKDMKPKQTFVFSATLTFVHSNFGKYLKGLKKPLSQNDKLNNFIECLDMNENPKIIDMTIDIAKLFQWKILCPNDEERDIRLFWFLWNHPGRTIIFTNSKDSVRRLAGVLKRLQLNIRCLTADNKEKVRLKNLEQFGASQNDILIASDVAAHGLDIPMVDFVIHFDVAHTAETHVHRSGRTARAGNPGHSILMLLPNEVQRLKMILQNLNKTFDDVKEIPLGDDVLVCSKLVDLARKIDSKQHVVVKVTQTKSWFERMAEEADIELDDRELTSFKKKMPSNIEMLELKSLSDSFSKLLGEFKNKPRTYRSPIPTYQVPDNVSENSKIVTVVKFDSDSQKLVKHKTNKRKRENSIVLKSALSSDKKNNLNNSQKSMIKHRPKNRKLKVKDF